MRVPQSGLKLDSPSWPLIKAVISYQGITDAVGAATGTTVVCGDLANEPSYQGLAIKMLAGDAAGQVRGIFTHPAGTGTITVTLGFTDNTGAAVQIVAGTPFVILSISGSGSGGSGGAPFEGVYSHPSGVAEQIVLTQAIAWPMEFKSLYLDLVNLTQNATVRVKYQIDGANYRTIETFNWTVGMDDGLYFREIAVNHNVQVTLQSAIAEGAARDVPYEYFLRP